MKLRRKLLLVLLGVLLLAPTALLYFAVSTQAGLRFIANRINGQAGSVTITIENVSGTLADGFSVGFLRVQHRRTDVRITEATGELRLLPLLRRQIVLSSGRARNVTVQVFRVPPRTGTGPGKLWFMPPTLSATADSLYADSTDLILMNGQTLHATAVSTAAEVLPEVIHVRGGKLDWQDMHIDAAGQVHADDPIGVDGKVSIDWHPQGQPAWRFDADFDGDLDRLPLKVDIGKPFHARFEGTATALTGQAKLTGNGTTDDLDITIWGAGGFLGLLSARVAITVDGNGFAARGPVTAPGLKAGPVQLDFHGAYADHRLTIRDTSAVHQPSGSRATVRGTVEVVPNGPRLALTGEWAPLQWPLAAAEPAFTSPRGRYAIEGMRPWKVTAEGETAAAGLVGMPASLRGSLGTESLVIEAATLGLFGGKATVTGGEARWRPAESWTVAGRMTGLDASQLRKDVTGQLDFDFRASGAPFGEAGSIDFAIARLGGRLRGQSASGSGRFTRAAGSQDWRFQKVDLRVGRARLQLDGSLNAPRDLSFAIDADDLSLFDEAARGRISARGRYAGTDAAPLLVFKARGADFEWQGYSVDALDADVDIDLQGDGHAQGKVDLTGVRHGAYSVRAATLSVAGPRSAQQVTLAVDAPPLRAALTAEGAMQERLWRGTINSFTVGDGGELALRLSKAAPVALSLEQMELGDLCLTDAAANGCASGRLDPDGKWSAKVSALAMPLRAFTAGLSQDMTYEGTINLRGEFTGRRGALPTGTLSGDLMQAQLIHTLSNKRQERLQLGSGTVQATATATAFSAQVALDAGAANAINGRLTGERNAGDWRDFPIRGELQARSDALPVLDMYIGDIDRAVGQISTRLNISGTLGTPVLTGQLQLRDASIDSYRYGIVLRELSADARFDTQTLDLDGRSRLGGGMASFTGKLSWRDNEPYGTLRVTGDNLRIVDLPEARIEASPRLDFKLAGRRLTATGEVLIPKARLEPKDLTNAVVASDDEEAVGEVPVDPEQRWLVTSEIRVSLGDDVNLDARGLKAQLGGSVIVRRDELQRNLGYGELNIKKGQFAAYGRLFDIERGKLQFDGALNNPSLELRAQKEFPDVVAGINVRGPLRAPRWTFYSDPQLTRSQIISLLAGGSLDSVQNNERRGGTQNDLLMQGGAIVAQTVGGRVGLDNVGVESDLNNSTSVVFGKYLSDRLFVSYGISLAEAINTIKMRWTIGKGFTFKTEAGKARSADIELTLKKGRKKKEEEKK
jgi:translocation and assembly module TamB